MQTYTLTALCFLITLKLSVGSVKSNEDGYCPKDSHCPEKDSSTTKGSSKTEDASNLRPVVENLLSKAQRFPSTIEGIREVLELRDEVMHLQLPKRTDHLPKRKSLQEAVDHLNTWANDVYTVDGIKGVVVDGMGLGLVASRDIRIKETVLELPVSNVIASQHDSDIFNCLGDIKAEHTKYPGLWRSANLSMIMVLEGRNRTGEFSAYINALPAAFTHASYFDISDFKMLQPSIAFETTANTACEVMAIYATIWLKLHDGPKCAEAIGLPDDSFSFDAFRWGYTASLTRNYDGSFHSDEVNKVMLPFWDLANHNDEQNVETHNMPRGPKTSKSDGKYSTLAERDIKAGEPIYMHYLTDLDPVESFATWGFVHMSAYALRLNLGDQEDPLYEPRKRILRKNDDWSEGLFLPDPDTLNGSRLLDYHGKKAFRVLIQVAMGNEHAEYTPRVIATAWKYLLDQIDHRIGVYQFSAQHLMNRRREELNPNKYTIYTELIEELLVLQRIRNYVEDVLKN